MIIALVISTFLNEEPASIIRGSPPLGASFIAGVEWMLVSFIGQTMILSGKSAEFHFFMVQRVWYGAMLNAQMVTMRVQLMKPLTKTSSLGC